MKANLYDFDKTVYPNDSMADFWLFCLKKHPKILMYLPKQFYALLRLGFQYIVGKGDIKQFKETFFSFFKSIDAKQCAEAFWAQNKHRIYKWFLPENRELPCVVCSGSPEFFLRYICDELKVDYLIGTPMDPANGRILGNNCRSDEKIERIKAMQVSFEFENAYSDAVHADAPLLKLAKRRYAARKGRLREIS